MRVLGLGAGGGIKDEEAGLDGGSIDALAGCTVGCMVDMLSVGLVLVICGCGGDLAVLLTSLPSSWSSLRENEGTVSFA
jgi:hypothetical protein